ncbi:MAG: TraB/GumN family protein [Bacteroidota bacterium]
MTPTLRCLLAALVAALPLAASAQPATEADTRNPLLFAMDDEDSRVYLFGSVHVLNADAYPLPADVEAAYADAEALAFELDMTNLAAIQGAVMTRAQYTDGRTLREAIGDSLFTQLEAVLQTFGAPVAAFNGFEPWAVQLTLAGLATQALGYDAQNGVDLHFTTRAQADGKPISGLETADDQMDIFDGMPETQQIAMLVQFIDEWDQMGAQFDALLTAWETGSDEHIAALMNDLPEGSRDALLRDRNAAWVPQIEALLSGSEDVLVVVGAGHLAGDDSVVAMLREKGYTLTRL